LKTPAAAKAPTMIEAHTQMTTISIPIVFPFILLPIEIFNQLKSLGA
jgi:hypothetical protein